MNISLTPLLEEKDRIRAIRFEELRKDVQEGLNELNSGKGIEVDESYFEDIKIRGRKKLTECKASFIDP